MNSLSQRSKRRSKRPALSSQEWYRATSLFEITDNKGIARLAEGFRIDPPGPMDLAEMERLFLGLCRRLAIAENKRSVHSVARIEYARLEKLPLTKVDSGAENPLFATGETHD